VGIFCTVHTGNAEVFTALASCRNSLHFLPPPLVGICLILQLYYTAFLTVCQDNITPIFRAVPAFKVMFKGYATYWKPWYQQGLPGVTNSTRARDFLDIHLFVEKQDLWEALHDPENLVLLEKIFAAKKVPLELLLNIKSEADFHRLDFQAVMATVATDIELHEFGYYFNYVVDLAESLKTALERKASSDH